MKLGTKSLLFGAHQFLLHPLFVAWAWTKLFGFPRDPRLWVAFLVHDWGYWGTNMQGEADLDHPRRGANVMHKLFDKRWQVGCRSWWNDLARLQREYPWYYFMVGHSRSLAQFISIKPSKLCAADKYALILTPSWLWRLQVWLSGEFKVYIGSKSFGLIGGPVATWLKRAKAENFAWVAKYGAQRGWLELRREVEGTEWVEYLARI